MNLPNFFFYTQPKQNKEKYTFSFGEEGIHYTLVYVAHKKAFDFHKKDDNIKSTVEKSQYHPFFEMSSFKFYRLLTKIGMFQEYLTRELILKNKINLGKFKRNNCWFFQLENINLPQEIYKIERKGRMLKSNKKFEFKDSINNIDFLHPDEIQNTDYNVFGVFRYKRGVLIFQGIVYKINGKLYFWNKKKLNLYMKLLLIASYNLLSQINFTNKSKLLKQLYEIITIKYNTVK